MTFTPALRRLTFSTHVTSSVGWLGAVVVFLALAVIGLTGESEMAVRGVYLVMAPAAWFVLVPLAHVSLLSGTALSLGTDWGLVRHYWVVVKLVITAVATVILLIYMGTFRQMAGVAADPIVELGMVRNPSPVVHAILALIVLLVATVLGIYKPFGMTAYGKRQHSERQTASRGPMREPKPVGSPRRLYATWVVVVGLVVLFVAAHLIGGRLGAH